MPDYVELSMVLIKGTTENVALMNELKQFCNAVTNGCTEFSRNIIDRNPETQRTLK